MDRTVLPVPKQICHDHYFSALDVCVLSVVWVGLQLQSNDKAVPRCCPQVSEFLDA
ncbi:unnamed protein product [Chondrus crispus]|uniref:Uncharacterized protein n=1 Tax=Chondrus crispus TaxID=2769 RepID=R7QDF7_CHOCR|nr:unnamed protein product [Chondrus crispus]CDF36109.1 unnamed protein product [Chondrus crispus]|eukprot:XP_005715928.1 unnamed protein product [Chondrus crispus]